MDHSGIPPRKVAGGLYTGVGFASKEWGNVPIVPEAGAMVHDSLAIGHAPPPEARYQYVADVRPGNSTPSREGLVVDPYTMMAFPPAVKD